MKNKIGLFISLIVLSLVFIGCQQVNNGDEAGEENGNGTAETDDATTLSVLHSFTGQQPEAEVIEPAFEKFDEANDDVELSIETAGGNDIEEVIRVRTSADDAPDVFTNWGMRRTEDYITNG